MVKLTNVKLLSNVCINESFKGLTRISVLQERVTEKCDYNRKINQLEDKVKHLESSQAQSMVTITRLEAEIKLSNFKAASMQSEMKMLETFSNKTKDEVSECKAEELN